MAILRHFRACGVVVISLREPFLSTDGPASELLVAVMAWCAEQERRVISERTKAGLARRRALGVILGRPKGSKDKRPRTRTCRKKPAKEKKAPPFFENSDSQSLKRNLNKEGEL
jgi:DNA invertase Pin-like site-specific DNA recombinase